jgi:NMD protein affecting ribosome stability and mRNA decay
MSALKVHTPFSEIIKATVVSRSGNEIQILHPYNYSTVDIKIPPGSEIDETVNVAVIDGTVFYVP